MGKTRLMPMYLLRKRDHVFDVHLYERVNGVAEMCDDQNPSTPIYYIFFYYAFHKAPYLLSWFAGPLLSARYPRTCSLLFARPPDCRISH